MLKRFLTPTVITLIASLLYLLTVLLFNQGDPMAFVLLGTRFSEQIPNGTEGYDGQFAYQIALNPLNAAPYIDVPAYRYQRILYPILARLLALGHPTIIPWTLLLVNLIAIGVGTWATEQLLYYFKTNRWYTLTYGLYGGQMLALRTDMNEPLAQALVQCAILAWVKEYRWMAVTAFAAAALTKETTLIFLAAYLLTYLYQKKWSWVVGLGTAVIPFIIYQFVLWQWLGQPGVGSGGAGATPFNPIPFYGWLSIAQVGLIVFLILSLIVIPLSLLPATAGVVMSMDQLRQGLFHPLVLSLLLNSIVIIYLPASTMREPAAMMRLTQGLVAAMILFGALTRSPKLLRYSTLWLLSNLFLLGGVAS